MRLPLLAVPLAALALAGCSLFGGDDYGDLAPGTFRFSADGETYTRTAAYHPNTDTDLASASVLLSIAGGGLLQIRNDRLLSAESGSKFEPTVAFSSNGYLYVGESGSVEVVSVGVDRIEGRFRFRLGETGSGPIRGSDITAEGGFYALLAED